MIASDVPEKAEPLGSEHVLIVDGVGDASRFRRAGIFAIVAAALATIKDAAIAAIENTRDVAIATINAINSSAAADAGLARAAADEAAASTAYPVGVLAGFDSSIEHTPGSGEYGLSAAASTLASANNTWIDRVAIGAYPLDAANKQAAIAIYIHAAGDGTGFARFYSGAGPRDNVKTVNLTGLTVGLKTIRLLGDVLDGEIDGTAIGDPSGLYFGFGSATGGAQCSQTNSGTDSGWRLAGSGGGSGLTFLTDTRRPRVHVTLEWGIPYTDYETVAEALLPLSDYGETSATFGADFVIGTALASGSVIYVRPEVYDQESQILTDLEFDVTTAGNYNLHVYQVNEDGTLAHRSTTLVAIPGGGLVEGLSIAMPRPAMLGYQRVSGGGTIDYTSGQNSFYVAGSGATEPLLSTANMLQVKATVQYRPRVKADVEALQLQIDDLSDLVPTLPTATAGEALRVVRALAALNVEGGTNVIRIAMAGDSWMERVWIPQRFRDIAGTPLGKAGHGWISVDSDYDATNDPPLYQMDGVTFAKAPRASTTNNAGALATGWITCDAAASGYTGIYDDYGLSVDGFCIATTRADATVAIGNLNTTAIRIYFRDTTGTFRYRTDGGSWTTVAGGGTNAVSSVLVSGLSSGVHTLDIDTTGNGGTVAIYGFYATKAVAGVEVSKIGNGGATAANLATISASIGTYLSTMLPHVLVIVDGTNDAGSVSKASWKASIQTYMNAVWAASPDTIIILAPSPEHDAGAPTALLPYAEGGFELALANPGKVEFFNARAASGARIPALWADGLHRNASGAREWVRSLLSRLFWGIGL